MADAILRIKTVMDIGDAASNIGALQKGLSKLKLPDKLNSNLNKNISEFYKEYDKYQRKVAEGIKTQSDQSQAEKSLNRMKSLYGAISKELNQVTKLDIDDIIDLGSGDFKRIADEISRTVKEINKIKVDKKPFEDAKTQIESLTKSKKITGDDGILNRMLGHINKGELTEAKSALDELKKYAEKAAPREVYSEKAKKMIAAPGTMSTEKYSALQQAIAAIEAEFGKADAKAAPLIQRLNELQKELGETKAAAGKDIIGGANDFKNTVKDVEKVTDSLKRMHQEEYGFKRQTQDIDRQIQSYFGLAQMIRKVGDIARAAFNTVKELDAAMVETAVVTNFDVGDMWAMLPEYTAQANQLGSTIKDVYEAATLYFQQGLNKQQSLGLANETLKMARIGGLQAAEATNMMTAALRGFNMEINGTSAQRINDVYSELAAITAADTKEIGSAMERTASIANSANMEFETTSAFLSQMIETTREAPENLGTAMKTIIARFQEMKQDPTKLVDSEGVAMDANKIDTALKTIGVDLTNQKGEFRDLDDVFLDISAKWDSLTQGQQRYIATIAAGSRQQSRFIAMMQNHERVMELVEAANNSAGASQKQFEKTLDSMSSKLNRLKNAWNQFTMGLMNDKLIKGGIDALTKSFTVINKIIDFLGKIPPKPFEGITKSALTLATTLGMLNIGKKMTRGSVMGVVGWWKKEGGFMENFKEGYGAGEATGAAKRIGTAFGKTFQETAGGPIKSTIEGIKNSYGDYKNTMAGVYGKYSAGFLKSAQDSGRIETQLATNLRSAFKSASANVDFGKLGYENADAYMDKFLERMKNPKTGKAKRMSFKNISDTIKAETGADISSQKVAKDPGDLIDKSNTKLAKFSNTVSSAGNAVQYFGMLLQNTPLAPFGTAISALGMGISAFGANIAAFQVAFTTAMEAGATSIKAFGVALWSSFGPIAAIMAALLALVGVIKLVDSLYESDKERLERMKDAAASASEAFDMAKQQTSELNDMLSRLEENEKSFDNLVEGTTEFNEQLVASNELVTELLQKFPMLNDPKYLSTDENGLMRINKAGIQAVKDYQKEIEAHATAMSLIQSADYSAEEKTQKAEEKEKPQKWKESDKAYQKRLDEAKLLRQQAEIEREVAKKSALRTALDAKHIQNVEALSEHYADLYDGVQKTIEAEVGLENKHDLRQEYAGFHGYTYEKGTKKMYASDGSEIDYDDAAIKDEVVEQRVLLQFEEDAGTLDGIIEDLDSKFSEVLKGSFEGSGHVISDLLSSNIETDTDLLEKIIGDTSGLEEVVNSLKEEEIAAILGKTTDEVSNNLDTYKKETVDLLTQKASDIAEAQSESYSKLAAMMAQTTLSNLTDAKQQQNQDLIARQIRDLKASEANTLSTVGQLLQEQVGTEAMSTFIKESSNIYLEKGEKTKDNFNKILDDINWESPTSRLKGYTDAINSSDKAIHNWGRSMLGAADEANIVGEAFDEFLGGDWSELQENVDEFKNAAGEIDGAGILKAAESSKTLKTLLDSGKVSATGMAQALQGIESGKISQVSGAVLELLSSMHELTDAALEAHNIIENFDPGIDFGEGEDFVKENAEKAKEYYDNGEWGNQQLQNYIKLAAGADKWDETLRKNKGDLHETTKELMKYVTTFKDGFQPAWDQMISGKNINGTKLSKAVDKAIEEGRIDEKLEKPFKDFEVSWDKNGYMQLDIGDLTTDELTSYFQEIYGVSKEYAQLLMQDLANYDGQVSAKLAQNDLAKKIEDPDFQKSSVDRHGNFTLSDVDINTLKEVLSEDDWKRLAKAVGQTADELEKNSFDLIDEKTGKRKEDYTRIAQDFAKIYGSGKNSMLSLYNAKTTANELETSGKLDFSKIISTMQAKGADQEQAMRTAYEIYKRGQQEDEKKTGVYDGQKIDDNLKTYEEFTSAIEGLTEKSQWYEVGQSIAEGIISFIDQKNSGEENPDDYNQSEGTTNESDETKWSLPKWLEKIFQPGSETTPPPAEPKTGPASGLKPEVPDNFDAVNAKIEGQIKTVNEHFKNLLGEIKPEEIDTPERQAALKQLTNTALTSGLDKITPEIYSSLKTFGISIDDAVKAGIIKQPSDKLLAQVKKKAEENADAQAKASADGYEGGGGHGGKRGLQEKGPKKAQEAQGTKESTYTVKTEDTQVDDTKKKVDELDAVANKGGTYTINTPGAKELTSAARAAKTLTNTKDTKTIGVKTGKVDTSSIKTASNAINKFKPKIDVGAKDNATAKAEKWRKTIDSKSATIDVSTKVTGKNVDIYVTKHVTTKNEGGPSTGGYITSTGVIYRARGGKVEHPGYPKKGTDRIPAYLTPGEYVQNRKAVKYFGIDFMRKINHKDLSGALQSFGSAAKGRYGRIGPKDKGGLTLTGEEGFEIAWLPSESRSMILGANGPQMIDLPNDAIVYTHEQSKNILRKRQPIEAGSHKEPTGRHKQPSGSTTPSKTKASKKKSKKKGKGGGSIKIIEVGGNISVWWENQNRKVEGTQRKVDELLKKFEKELKEVGKTRSKINDTTKDYREQLKRSIALNTQSENKANSELDSLDHKKSSRSISYEVTEVKKGKKSKKTKTGKVNLASYISYDAANDTYVINEAAIKKVAKKNKSKAQAIKDLAEKEINDRISKRNTARDNIIKAQEALEKLNNDIYEAFDRWEKSITEIYLISQKLETITKKLSIASSQTELEFSKLEAGVTTVENALPSIIKALDKQREGLLSQAQGKKQYLIEAQEEFAESLDFTAYIKKYLNNAGSTLAKGDYDAAVKAFDFLKDVNLEGKEFDYNKAIKALDDKKYNEETNNQIKTVLDKIFEKQNKYLEAVSDAYDAQKEIYDKLEEYQAFISDFEQDLLSGIEEQAEDQIKRLDKLNSSLSKAFKDLIDEVKDKLDERRKKEDNADTETDIAKKQQRLAALRADTSGGNQVEIAQLEKEIAEAQQSYQRSLEDQLLDRLQDQADKAEKQRERQINLLEMQKEIAKQTGTNLEQVNEWLKNPNKNKEEIKQAWLANKNYDEVPFKEREQLEQQFEAEWTKYLAYGGQILEYEKLTSPLNSAANSLVDAKSSLSSLENTVDAIADNLLGIKSNRSAALMKSRGMSAKQLAQAGYEAKELKDAGFNTKQIVDAGYKKNELSKAGISTSQIKAWNKSNPKNKISASTVRNAKFTAKEAHDIGYSDKEIHGANYTAEEFKGYSGGGIKGAEQAKAANYSNAEIAKAYGAQATMGSSQINMKGTTYQNITGASAKSIQAGINASKTDKAEQSDMAGVKVGTVDVNGGAKGGKVKGAHIGRTGTTVGVNKGSTLYTKGWNAKKGKVKGGKWKATTVDKLTVALLKNYPKDGVEALVSAIRNKKVGSKINKSFKALAKQAGIIGKTYKLKNGVQATIGSNGKIYYNSGKKGVQIWDPAAGKLSLDKYNKKNFKKIADGKSLVRKEYAQVLRANKVKGYKTGGLADQTGPAWLDGTPSKPELVLNAADTQNFLALKDVLSKAVSSSKSVSNSYGDTAFEINVNVDHINNDYDVDKIVTRVKKDITKSAGYRNVTQVRNFR